MGRWLFLVPLLFTAVAAAEAPKRPPVVLPPLDVAKLTEPQEAARAVALLEKQFPQPRPEAVRMLLAILKGSELDGPEGWFGPAQTRYTWAWLAAKHGIDAKGEIARDAFRGPAAVFEALDRNGDGKVAATDLDWSDNSPYVAQANLLNRLFRRMDSSGDGKLTREELDDLFKRVADGKDHFTADDFRRAMIPRGSAGFSPGDAPSLPVLVRGLYTGELGSIQEGPAVGEAAPDFTLPAADGKQTVHLAPLLGKRPTVLVFGNFTCSPFRGLFPDVDAAYGRYKDRANFVMVYVREAHPTDGWKMEANARVGVAVKQPTTDAERAAVCGQFRAKLRPGMTVLVDGVADAVGNAYSAMPARLYVIDAAGKVAYKSGRGPFGFKPGEMEQALAMSLLEAAPAKDAKPSTGR
ncbi:deiodinase family protein [Limnoglobus roseus]|uniref:Iodothyronine deiodinase n=1 Tax=Limnoglobus roseus TaxID=2598579 RepID=A0A5C1A8U9_9BACT|nr:deiodinase family protein [Limnoglobus roseus]QEL13528.1 hypothetical protein PX52LOC_00386 [Limnoglobus roseus]